MSEQNSGGGGGTDSGESVQAGVVERLQSAMQERGRTANWLAGELGMYQSTLSRQLANRSITLDTVVGAAKALRLDLLWLLTGETKKPPASEEERVELVRINARERERLTRFLETALAPIEMALEELREGTKELSDDDRRRVAQNVIEQGSTRRVANDH